MSKLQKKAPHQSGEESIQRNIIVIGASAGGVEAILKITRKIPADLPAAIFIVHHFPPHTESDLHQIINRDCKIPAVQAQNGVTFEIGKIYCARANQHLLLEGGKILLTKGPRENRFRPSIDALFRSAAYEYKERVIGVILSGTLNDGTAGMYSIKRFGGLTVIQEPSDAVFDSMPKDVVKHVEVDYQMPANRIGELLSALTQKTHKFVVNELPDYEELIELEVNIAKNENALREGVFELGEFTGLACPDCHGAVKQYHEGDMIRFRCHTGHSFTLDALLFGITENIEKDLWRVMRGMEENNFVLKTLALRLKDAGQVEEAKRFTDKAKEIIAKSRVIHGIIEDVKILSKDSVVY